MGVDGADPSPFVESSGIVDTSGIVGILGGATATGKSALALRLAEANGFEIISADSRQLYRDMDIGTNAPSAADREKVRHHLVGVLDASQAFSPREFPGRVAEVLAAYPGVRFLIVGGTGLYLKELLYPADRDRGPTPEAVRQETQAKLDKDGLAAMHAELLGLDPEGMRRIHPHDRYRILKRWENFLITGESYTRLASRSGMDPRFENIPFLWLDLERESLYRRIDARVNAMAGAGWLEETRRLMGRPDYTGLPAFTSLGYREMALVAKGALNPKDALEAIGKKTRNYAKRQATFFRHQFPLARRWDTERLETGLEASGWDWRAFRERAP